MCETSSRLVKTLVSWLYVVLRAIVFILIVMLTCAAFGGMKYITPKHV